MGGFIGVIERWFGVTSFFGLGLLAAVVLLVALLVVLPVHGRSKIVAPSVFVAVHIGLEIVGFLVPKTSGLWHSIQVLASLALLLGIGRGLFVLVADGIFAARLGRPLPRIVRDIFQSVVYSAVLLVTLRVAGVEVSSLLATSALLTAVVGLSLQDTLGNLFAGISIQMQRPFEVGDFIQFDPDAKLIGRVIEINWRATTVLTNDEMEVIVPNGTLAKAPIRNYTKPSPLARRSVDVTCGYDLAPERVRKTILAALAGIPDVLAEPAPTVLASHFGQAGIDYLVRYFTADFAVRDVTDSAVRERIWYAFRRADIAIPFPRREIYVHDPAKDEHKTSHATREAEVVDRLRGVDFLAVLPKETLGRLATMTHSKVYAPRETVIRQGDPGDTMFLIVRGEVSVIVGRSGIGATSVAEVARLRVGGLFGEMSLMTGEPRAATIQAVSETELVVVGKDAFSAILAEAPELVAQMTRVLVERQEELESHLAARAARPKREVIEERTSALISRVKGFFQMRS